MLRNRLYYLLKPFVPRPLRLGVRRWWTKRRLRTTGAVWPIVAGSGRPPLDWNGWVGGKEFAFVLTHDVESKVGLARVRDLMRLEMEMGYRSSFNFIPKGGYDVPEDLIDELVANGFEVGVHDFRHDGTLFQSLKKFRRQAAGINETLKRWGAVGFRSGFMLNNLDWLHELKIEYDASTFDTDPFEPQPEGRHTIFPFFVHGELGRSDDRQTSGYVELPYTLPQDSTLFLLMGEKTPELWLRKLDWIASHGGMALVNVHPDYMDIGRPGARVDEYSVECYRSFLAAAKEAHQHTMWHALPKEVAAHVRAGQKPCAPASGRRIGMITYSAYESDNRVMRYAESLAARGDRVEVFSLRSRADLPVQERVNGVHVCRIQDRLAKSERSKWDYLVRLARFWWGARANLRRREEQQPYDLLHIHNMPDFLVFAGVDAKRRGAPIILDIHDILPEFFASKFKGNSDRLFMRALQRVERWSARFADHIIISNHLWKDRYASRTGSERKCSVYINHVNSDLFTPLADREERDRLVILFPGGLYWHQGVDIAIRAFQKVAGNFPQAEFHIYGDGDERESLMTLARELDLTDRVRFFKPVSTREIAAVMARADLGVVPKRADSFGNEAYSTKIMEFMSVGVPVIISETKIDRFYFDDSVVRFFPTGDVEALAKEMTTLLGNELLRADMARAGKEYAAQNSWMHRCSDYFELVDSLCAKSRPELTAV